MNEELLSYLDFQSFITLPEGGGKEEKNSEALVSGKFLSLFAEYATVLNIVVNVLRLWVEEGIDSAEISM